MSEAGKEPAAKKKPTTEEPVTDRSSADIGIVCTHKGELKSFLKRVDRQRSYTDRKITVRGGFLGEVTRIAIAEAGEGFASHRAATELLINEHKPSWILSVGFSSSLSEDVQPGDIVLSNEISDTHVNSLPIKCTITARKRIHVGKLIVADHHPITSTDKASLKERFPGLAVDTSSLAVAQVCQERSIRFMAIRVAVDSLNEEHRRTTRRSHRTPASGLIFLNAASPTVNLSFLIQARIRCCVAESCDDLIFTARYVVPQPRIPDLHPSVSPIQSGRHHPQDSDRCCKSAIASLRI